eukprot:Sdes_comp15351_c0_seq1m4219
MENPSEFLSSFNLNRKILNKNRRQSVSGESYDPYAASVETQSAKVVIPKSAEAYERIQAAVCSNLLFRNLDAEQAQTVYDAMFERKVTAGDAVIRQGDDGDFFYVVDKGCFEVFVESNGVNRKVAEVTDGESFGELALMYNSPRAATVVAKMNSVLWALDRETFRRILVNSMAKKRRLYESFLEKVAIFKSLEPLEKLKVVDALLPISFLPQQVIIRQGDANPENFYIVESGQVLVTKKKEDGSEIELCRIQEGGYFGEVALMTDTPRQATVVAVDHVKCLALNRAAFVRLMGPVRDVLARNMDNYRNITCLLANGNYT